METPREQPKFEQTKKEPKAPEARFFVEHLSDFTQKFKLLEGEAAEMGIDIKEALRFLETGEGNPEAVKNVLSEIKEKKAEAKRKEIEAEEKKRKKDLVSSEELGLILSKEKFPYDDLLNNFDALLEKGKERLDTLIKIREKDRGITENVDKGKTGPANFESYLDLDKKTRIREARKDFQILGRNTLELMIPLSWQIEEGKKPTEKQLAAQNQINFFKGSLEKKAEELAKKFNIDKEDIYNPDEENQGIYLRREYLEEGFAVSNLEQPNREGGVKKAREKFQRDMFKTLQIMVDLYKSLEGGVLYSDEKRKDILENISFYNHLLERRAVELGEKFGIGWELIFESEDDPKKYLTKEYIEEGPHLKKTMEKPEGFARGEVKEDFPPERDSSPRREKIKEAKEDFRNKMFSVLSERSLHCSELLGVHPGEKPGLENIVKKINEIDEQLKIEAAKIAELYEEKYHISFKTEDIFNPNFCMREAFLEFVEKTKETWKQFNSHRDKLVRNALMDEIENIRAEVAKKHGVAREEVKYDFMTPGEDKREPYSGV